MVIRHPSSAVAMVRVEEVEVSGPIVGMLSEVEFGRTEFRLEPGDATGCSGSNASAGSWPTAPA